jgi:hypothetical protein
MARQSKTSMRSSLKTIRQERERDCLSRYNYGNGFGWRSKVDKKKANRHKGQTSGRTKGATCQASLLDRFFCRCSRSYKHPGYNTWVKATRLWK